LLENETNRFILARHVGTDFLCCATVAVLGAACFTSVCPDFLDAAAGKAGAMPKAGFEQRMFTYQPAAFRMSLFFFAYQMKNMYDTIVWHDGIEFVMHHLLCFCVAYGVLKHGAAHFHAPFFFGISESSTAILCLLANFDDDHGVPGLADAFPAGKVALGVLFAVAFILCRVFLWTFFSYYLVRDAWLSIKSTEPSRAAAKPTIYLFLISLAGLSFLQVIWLGQIILVAKEELGRK
jgi:hypothetical protein